MTDIDPMGALGRAIERARADRKEQKVTEYAPTTEEIIRKFATGATWQHQGFTSAEAEIRRWLAAHDAEVRAAVLAEQGEPEWEYALIADGDDEPWSNYYKTLASLVDDFDGLAWREDEHLVRRRPAGPWLPVEDPS